MAALGINMDMYSHPKYFLSVEGQEVTFNSYPEVLEAIDKALSQENGKLSLSADDGLRPWWQRFIFGANNYIRLYFSIEWSNNISGLIFHDQNASEYRVLSNAASIEVSESIRNEISFGESEPLEIKYCLQSEVAFKAIKEFLNKGVRPEWLKFEIVR